MATEPNAPINPTIWDDRHNPQFVRDNDGLTTREYIAIKAMTGFIASCNWNVSVANLSHAESTAKFAVMYADELIKELNKKP